MSHKLGIDLGTYNSSAAVAIDDDPCVIVSKYGPTPNGKNFPSFVQFDEQGKKLCVGAKAKNAWKHNPKLVVWGVKRLVGMSYQAAVDRKANSRFAYDIERGPDDGILIRVGGERFTPSHILEAILREVKEDAENDQLNAPFGPYEEAIITVPAYYKAIRIAPIVEAAQQAGFKAVHTIAEPTAAAVSYGLQIDREALILAFDLGAGTLDVTLLQVVQEGNKLACGEICTSGNEELGGLDMDDFLLKYVCTKHNISPPRNELAYLQDESEQAKIRLSRMPSTPVHFPGYNIMLSRNELEDVLGPLLTRCRAPIQVAIKQAGLEASSIDHVLLVGGPTKMPCVRRAVRDELASLGARRELLEELDRMDRKGAVDPMECVSIGAALNAAGIGVPACTSLPEGWGTTYGSHYGPIIKENSMYPIDGTRSLVYPDPNAKTLEVELVAKRMDPDKSGGSTPVFQYERHGQLTLSVLPMGELHTVDLVLAISIDKTLTATLTHRQTGNKVSYQKLDSLRNEIVQLIDDGNIPTWDRAAREAYQSNYNPGKSAWTKQELEACVQKAMSLLELARGYDHERLQAAAKALQSSINSVSYADPNEAAKLANSIREFLDLLRQPEIGLIKADDFWRHLDDLTRIAA
ncbi:MAG TPA: Hsp70 family protein [Bryobacteraceae bacterium]